MDYFKLKFEQATKVNEHNKQVKENRLIVGLEERRKIVLIFPHKGVERNHRAIFDKT